MLEALCVRLCVTVVCTLPIGKNVVAIFTELVGCSGFAVLAVILVGGWGCIEAYRVAPVCMVYSTSYSSSATLETSAGSLTVVSTADGPVVSFTLLITEIKSALKELDMPL
jgi:hypothetical protein